MSNKTENLTLGQLYHLLNALGPNRTAQVQLTEPHSYRGNYKDVAFELEHCADISLWASMMYVRDSIHSTFCGWKGGEYRMDTHSRVWIAPVGICREDDETRAYALTKEKFCEIFNIPLAELPEIPPADPDPAIAEAARKKKIEEAREGLMEFAREIVTIARTTNNEATLIMMSKSPDGDSQQIGEISGLKELGRDLCLVLGLHTDEE